MRNFMMFGLLFLIASSCSSIKVTADYDKSVDFSQFKTYSYLGWAKDSDQLLTRFDKERIEEAFEAEFNKRGMTFQESDGDVAVSLFLVLDAKTSTTAYTNHYGGYGGWGYGAGWGWGMGSSNTTYQDYDYVDGTLVCDVFDASQKKLIWQGVGSATVDEKPETREKKIPQKVQAIMAKYPVPAAK